MLVMVWFYRYNMNIYETTAKRRLAPSMFLSPSIATYKLRIRELYLVLLICPIYKPEIRPPWRSELLDLENIIIAQCK